MPASRNPVRRVDSDARVARWDRHGVTDSDPITIMMMLLGPAVPVIDAHDDIMMMFSSCRGCLSFSCLVSGVKFPGPAPVGKSGPYPSHPARPSGATGSVVTESAVT